MDNKLYYGDNLEILRHHVADESVDLVYLDPPFNSKADYNILFKEHGGDSSQAQITAFEDTWHWTEQTERTFQEIVERCPANVVEMMRAFRSFVGENDMMAYLTMMCIRLVELRRVLKPTGSIYLHCDPTASHYLKIVMDTIFGKEFFRNEIVWRRTNSHNKTTKQYGPIHDTILFYSRGKALKFHPGVSPYTKRYIEDRFKHLDERGRYQTNYLTGPQVRSGESGKEWRGFNPTSAGRHWAIPKSLKDDLPNGGDGMSSHEKLEYLYEKRLIVFPKKEGGQPMYKQYIGNGVPYQDLWAYQPNTNGVLFNSDQCIDEDVKYLESEDEKQEFPTQKPMGLLERIIATSTDENDIVLDPFCGCGTAVTAAQKLNRKWIGIDVTHLAINLIKWRMNDMFKLDADRDYEVIGEPKDAEGAAQLAVQDRYQFQWWALSLINARPYGDKKKGSDKGIDGFVYFRLSEKEHGRGIVSVKSGKVSVKDVRDLGHVVEREKAQIGILLTLEPPTRDMKTEAVKAGFYKSPLMYGDVPKLQITTIDEIFKGVMPVIPSQVAVHKKAKRETKKAEQAGLEFEE